MFINVEKAREWAYYCFIREKEINNKQIMDEVDYLLAHVLNWNRSKLYTYPEYELSEFEKAKLKELVTKRKEGIPFHYLTGKKEFMGFEFFINRNVLVPRPETELLVEEALKCIEKLKKIFSAPLFVLEPCTGSGVVSLSLAKLSDMLKIYAVDISEKALDVARKNKEKLGIGDHKITFYQGDLFSPIPSGKKFHMILLNPPYIPSGEFESLSPEVNNEPRLALDGGSCGMEYYYKIKSEYKNYLLPGGIMLLEIGKGQEKDLVELFSPGSAFTWTIKDLSSVPRIVAIKL